MTTFQTATSSSARARDRRAHGKVVARWIKRGVGLVFLTGVGVLLVIAWLPKPIAVDVAQVTSGALRVSVDEDGRTRVKDRYVISAPLAGTVGRLELDPGDAVEQGAMVAHLLPLPSPLLDARTRSQSEARVAATQAAERRARAQIGRAETASQFAKSEAERQHRLSERGGTPLQALERADYEARAQRQELKSARFAAKVASHEVQMAKAALGRVDRRGGSGTSAQFDIPSPVSGRVLRVIQESEGVVQAGTALLEVGDPGALEIVIDVLTSDAVDIQKGALVRIERWGGKQALTGRVRRVEPSAFTKLSALGVEEQRVNVIVDLQDPREQWSTLGDGYRVEARIFVWQADEVLKVPASALFRRKDGWAVFHVVDGIAKETAVEVGRASSDDTQITKGLTDGDTVVVHPSDQIADGVAVQER